LIELEREGMVCTLSNGRKMVKEFDDKTIIDIYQVRAVMECEAAELINNRIALYYYEPVA